AAAALQAIDVRSVFDLALSRVFDTATRITAAADDPTSTLARFGAAATDMLRPGAANGDAVGDLRFRGLDILAGVPDAATLGTALGATTVRDLAVYPPYRAARALLDRVFFPDAVSGTDPEAPADL